MKPSTDPLIELRWPLIDLGMTRAGCLAWMESSGFPRPPRSACVFCPYHSREEWSRLKREEPEEFQRAVEFERAGQAAARLCQVLTGMPYLTRDAVPLDSIDFDAPSKQMNLFSDSWDGECEGMCGV